ncbi:hypothetical protein BD310DRAFT_918805 [Dichomitus squalens]|uniref:Uncharacterized protein n=1 Tax=Dichomitus squalens TaxID=114155 RepID=A0A4Q9Q5P2_9APHY|nr:hypothetical protein BD310DRAFT_918805 [Dichomitus squalens]
MSDMLLVGRVGRVDRWTFRRSWSTPRARRAGGGWTIAQTLAFLSRTVGPDRAHGDGPTTRPRQHVRSPGHANFAIGVLASRAHPTRSSTELPHVSVSYGRCFLSRPLCRPHCRSRSRVGRLIPLA